MQKHLLFIALMLTFLSFQGMDMVNAQSFKVQYLTADEGLSRNLVHDIIKDSRGFVWFATAKGLDRFDGYGFIHYNSSQKEHFLPIDQVNCLLEDKNGDLWIGTENGLYYQSFEEGSIISAVEKFGLKDIGLSGNIRFLRSEEKGSVWVGHDQGLTRIQADKGKFSDEIVLKSNNVRAILIFNGNIFVGAGNNVFRIVKGNGNSYSRINSESRLNGLSAEVNSLFYDDNFIWIGTSNGLYEYDPVYENLTLYRNDPANPSSLSSNVITCIARTKENQLFIGTLIGVNVFDYISHNFRRINTESADGDVRLNNNFVSCILPDDKILWVGTEKGGINKLTSDPKFFVNYVHDPKNPQTISKNPVNAIYEDREGNLLVGSVEGGLNIRKKGSQEFMHFVNVPGNSKSLSHNSVSSICQDFRGDYWVATWGFGLNRLPSRYTQNSPFDRFVTGTNGISNNFIASLVRDDKWKGIWVGGLNGLDFLDIQKMEFKRILPQIPYEKGLRLITSMMFDDQRRLWAGTSNGLFMLRFKGNTADEMKIEYEHFQYLLADTASRIIEKINCILQSKDGDIWLGSNGNGLYKYLESNGKSTFVQFKESDGLLDNVIYGILEDESGSLWMSTDKGICAFNPSKRSFRNFTKDDGLVSNQFYWDAFCKTRDGKIYFGNVSGMTSFDPLKYSVQSSSFSVKITQISVLNQNVYPANATTSDKYLKFDQNHLKTLILSEDDKTFSIEFSALDHQMPQKIKYSYRLKGFDDEWMEVKSDRRFANFTNIGSGNYEFEVRCTNPDGTWSDQISNLQIHIVPPFYKRAWFILLVVILLLYMAYSFVSYRLRLLKSQEVHLKQLVEERTQKIEIQKEELREQAVKIQEATIDKIAFFTNITHEFRTPITLILGPVERALKLSTNPKVLEQLNIVRRNSQLLLSLINQLMDFRKIDSDKMELSRSFDDFVAFLDNIIIPFEETARDRGVIFHSRVNINPPVLLFDKDSMHKVISNLLSNAIKFTPDGGEISVSANVYSDGSAGNENLHFTVKNSGRNIPEYDLEKIFERFYQSKEHESVSGNGQSGTGIGLYLCKRIIELNQGHIEAQNTHPGEVSFKFIVPVERKSQDILEIEGRKLDISDIDNEHDDDDFTLSELRRGKPTLLIVEDNKDMRLYIRSFLSSDFNILEAANGAIGLELTNRFLPDIIISDIMMPVMDGLEFCTKIKTSFATSHIPVVLLTAKTSIDTQVESFKSGADSYLIKPFDENLLKAVISNLNEKKHKIQNSFSENMDTEILNFDSDSHDKKFLDKALQVVRENYTQPEFDVTEFIDLMAISRSLLHKKLTSLAGQSASRFIRTYRLNMARELIIKNRDSHAMNISEIAYQVGFNDPKYFTRCFTKQFGIQPSMFMERGGVTSDSLNEE